MTASVALIGLRLNCQCACKHGSLAEIHFRATVTPAGWRGLNPFTPRRDRRLSALHMKCLPPPYCSCFPTAYACIRGLLRSRRAPPSWALEVWFKRQPVLSVFSPFQMIQTSRTLIESADVVYAKLTQAQRAGTAHPSPSAATAPSFPSASTSKLMCRSGVWKKEKKD